MWACLLNTREGKRIKKIALMMGIRIGESICFQRYSGSDFSFRNVELKQVVKFPKGIDFWVHGKMKPEHINKGRGSGAI